MKKILLIFVGLILLITNSYGVRLYDAKLIRNYKRAISSFNKSQWETIINLYNKCSKYDFGYTCVAIGYLESRLGVYLINEKTHDYGVTGINIYYYFKDHRLKWNYWRAQKIKTQLVINENFAIRETIRKLKMWKNKYRHVKHAWIKIWGSYNGGNKPNYNYSKKVYNFILAFKWYIRRHSLQILFRKG